MYVIKWAECSLIIGTSYRAKVFAWSSTAQSVCEWAFSLLVIWCLRLLSFESCIQSAEETNLSPFDSKIACLYQSIKINNNKTSERRKTFGHLRSINRNMIIHFANQSQTCQLLKILKNISFSNISWKESEVKWWNQSQVELIKKIHIDYQEVIYIYIYACQVLGITF